MGFIKDVKAESMGKEAQKAWEAGAPVFTPILIFPASRPVDISARVEDWELMVAAILDVGWKLHTWTVYPGAKGRPQAQPLFVRPEAG